MITAIVLLNSSGTLRISTLRDASACIIDFLTFFPGRMGQADVAIRFSLRSPCMAPDLPTRNVIHILVDGSVASCLPFICIVNALMTNVISSANVQLSIVRNRMSHTSIASISSTNLVIGYTYNCRITHSSPPPSPPLPLAFIVTLLKRLIFRYSSQIQDT